MNAANQQMRLRLIRRQVQGPVQFLDRLAVLFLLNESPPAIDVKPRQIPLVALRAASCCRVESRMRKLHGGLDSLEPPRNGFRRRAALPLLVGRRESSGGLLLAASPARLPRRGH